MTLAGDDAAAMYRFLAEVPVDVLPTPARRERERLLRVVQVRRSVPQSSAARRETDDCARARVRCCRRFFLMVLDCTWGMYGDAEGAGERRRELHRRFFEWQSEQRAGERQRQCERERERERE